VPLVSEALGDHHDLSTFASGQPSLDTWLAEHARGAEARRVARTFVWHDGDSVVVAYYTLTAHVLARDQLPRSLGRGSPERIPAALLARLAFDRHLQGQGLGAVALAEALGRVVEATKLVAARFVVVDAIDDAAARFYEHHGFKAIPGTMRLVQKLSDVAAALEG
jgi:GNAT superfamily N-acetyltransferase